MKNTEKNFAPQIVLFKDHEFKIALSRYNLKNDLEAKIQKLASTIESEFKINLDQPFANQLFAHLENSEANLMKLPGQKIAELKSINTSELTRLENDYKSVKYATKPNEKDFCIYTENESENERLKAYKELMKAFYKMTSLVPESYYNLHRFKQTFSGLIDWDFDNPSPSIAFIKGKI
jgi:hypothetical protein